MIDDMKLTIDSKHPWFDLISGVCNRTFFSPAEFPVVEAEITIGGVTSKARMISVEPKDWHHDYSRLDTRWHVLRPEPQ